MKNLIAPILLAIISYNSPTLAQTKQQDEVRVEESKTPVYKNLLYKEPVFKQVDTYPKYSGGFVALEDFFKKNLNTRGETGKVIATFVVEKDGSINNIEVVRSFSDQAKAEALRVIALMPKWKPGIKDGRIVRTQFAIPISFQKR